MWPQITWVVLVALSLGIHAAKHGQPRDPYNFGLSVISAVLAAGLLYAGGFFNPMNGG